MDLKQLPDYITSEQRYLLERIDSATTTTEDTFTVYELIRDLHECTEGAHRLGGQVLSLLHGGQYAKAVRVCERLEVVA